MWDLRTRLLSSLALAALLGSAGPASAAGIPQQTPLFYAGVLEDGSGLVEGQQLVGILFWDAEAGGNTVCTTAESSQMIVRGTFRVALDVGCVAAVQQHPELWVEVTLNGESTGRAKIAAVPYAIEAALLKLPNAQAYAGVLFAVNYAAFGLVMILFLVFEPLGLVGIWHRIQTYFLLWPFKHRPVAGARK